MILHPPTPKILKALKYKLICEAVKVEGFSVDKNGKETPNGISCVIPTKVIGIEWPKKRKRRAT
jgi:hypothetical protein